MPEKRVGILGAGSWGMAVSHLMHLQGCQVKLWEYEPEAFKLLSQTRSNPRRLKSFVLDKGVVVTDDLAEAVEGVEVVALAVPSQHLRDTIRKLKGAMAAVPVVVNLAKGVELDTLRRMSEVIAEEAGLAPACVATVSGPSHAEEVVEDMPTTVVAASTSEDIAARVQELFSVGHFRVYKSSDIVGVELGGALKNIIAIAAGIVDGLGLGDNTKGALMTRGLAEITRLGLALGARPETFAGLSGMGDLVTTCISKHSRNRHVGDCIGKGESLDDILAGMSMVAEGVQTTHSGFQLAQRHQIEMPITEAVYRVLFEGKPAREAVGDLMERRLRAEVW
ncbi:MAG: NAD(P)H-dependent glycerol-3-phosphate dehydrogenase [bacterium]|nr:NAD(P)H-dependent glycerol-3-phosphate dehydrogenase [bacterium]